MFRFLNNRKYQNMLLVLFALVMTPGVVGAADGEGFLTIGLAIFSFFVRITAFAGIVLNLAVIELVFEFGAKMQDNFGASVENAWTVIRDFINLLFIFGLVYIGFKVILDADTGHARKLLPALIVAALLINFSLFFSKVIIDFTNIASIEIYEATVATANPEATATTSSQAVTEDWKNIGVSGAYWQIMGLKDLIAPRNGSDETQEAYYRGLLVDACAGGVDDELEAKCQNEILIYFLVGSIMVLVSAYAFLAGAFLLVVRFITLIMLMIGSPLMFIGAALPIPEMQKLSKQWWSMFLASSFMAPVYFILLYLGLAVGSRVGATNGGELVMSQAAMGNYEATDGILNLIIVCAFCLMAVTTARSMAKSGSSMVLNGADNVRRRGQRLMIGAAAGSAAWATRNTVGRQADKAANSDRLRNLASSNNKLYAWAGRQAINRSRAVADSSFDARNSAAVGGAIGMLGGKATDELGKGGKKGYSSIKKDRDKEREKFAESLGTLDVSKDKAGNYNDAAVGERVKAEQARIETENNKIVAEKQEALRKHREETATLGAEYDFYIESGGKEADTTRMLELRNKMSDGSATAEDKKEFQTVSDRQSKYETQKNKIDQAGVAEKALNDSIIIAQDKINNAEKTAEASIEYSRQLSYKKAMESADKLTGIVADSASAVIGAAAGAAVAPAALGALAYVPGAVQAAGAGAVTAGKATLGVAGANVGLTAAGLVGAGASWKWRDAKGSLHKKYGDDGTKAQKRKKQKEKAKDFADAAKDLGEGGGGDGKKDDGGDGKKDDT